jgi:hypothetical protein
MSISPGLNAALSSIDRARANGDDRHYLMNAVTSLLSDLHKHPDWQDAKLDVFGEFGFYVAIKSGPEAVRAWIERFN